MRSHLALIALTALGPHQAPESAARADTSPIQVLVLGTFHMAAEPGPMNPTVDDLLEPERQAELDSLVEGLAAFGPTKVALEALAGAEVLRDYDAFLAGELAQRMDERHQVGFRLANKAGHSEVFGVDHDLRVDPQEILTWAMQNGQGEIAGQAFRAYMEVSSKWSARFMRESTIREIYSSFNSTATDRAMHEVFLSMLRVGNEDDPVGASQLARWFERNAHIAGNVLRLAAPGDRIVVLFGANHRKLLVELLDGVPGVEVVDSTRYLAE